MEWKVETVDYFDDWWDTLNGAEQEDVTACVGLLEVKGPQLPSPYSSGINGSDYSHMRELRIQHKGNPYRVLYAFDPRRVAMLLLGGDKTGDDKRWYKVNVPIADKLYSAHLKKMKRG